eukprot:1109597-Prorocentrum_minimum.AAC.1
MPESGFSDSLILLFVCYLFLLLPPRAGRAAGGQRRGAGGGSGGAGGAGGGDGHGLLEALRHSDHRPAHPHHRRQVRLAGRAPRGR